MEKAKHPIRNSLLALTALILFGGGLSLILAFDNLETLKEDCQKPNASKQDCITRMLAAGHYDSHKKNYKEAEEWYFAAAKLDDREAMFHLGWLNHALGVAPAVTGGKMDEKKLQAAVEWYQKSAAKGFAPAMNNLGVMKLTVRSQFNSREGITFIIKAARAYNPFATWTAVNYTRQMINPTEDERLGRWNPSKASPRDLSRPTLERTLYQLKPASKEIIERAREAAKNGESLLPPAPSDPAYTAHGLQPVKIDPNMPTFREVQEKMRREQQGR